ncbi:MAG: hypothetical protein KatS3mg013_0400 [Actinomycetota bacterium]|jgi:polyhydroxyalkanoate synthesis regulator phasin|nr:MAG: hypothetical protein KatS3mg013_0400 [Actinomycetota bacterium]
MARVDELRKTIEAALGQLTPAKAQQLARSWLEPEARKEQVAKATTELLEWSQRNRERLRTLVRKEIREQLSQIGVATKSELETLRKRVRELERAAGARARTAATRSSRSSGSGGGRRSGSAGTTRSKGGER